MLVRKGKYGRYAHVEYDGFKATPRQLEVLSLKADGLTHRGVGVELGISWGTSKQHLHNLKVRNAKGETKILPSSLELMLRAEELGLLNTYAIKGLRSIIEKTWPS